MNLSADFADEILLQMEVSMEDPSDDWTLGKDEWGSTLLIHGHSNIVLRVAGRHVELVVPTATGKLLYWHPKGWRNWRLRRRLRKTARALIDYLQIAPVHAALMRQREEPGPRPHDLPTCPCAECERVRNIDLPADTQVVDLAELDSMNLDDFVLMTVEEISCPRCGGIDADGFVLAGCTLCEGKGVVTKAVAATYLIQRHRESRDLLLDLVPCPKCDGSGAEPRASMEQKETVPCALCKGERKVEADRAHNWHRDA